MPAPLIPILLGVARAAGTVALRAGGAALRAGGRAAAKAGAKRMGARLTRRGFAAARKAAPRGSMRRSFFREGGGRARAIEQSGRGGNSFASNAREAVANSARGGDSSRDIDVGGSRSQASGGQSQGDVNVNVNSQQQQPQPQTSNTASKPTLRDRFTNFIRTQVRDRMLGDQGRTSTGSDPQADEERAKERREKIISKNMGDIMSAGQPGSKYESGQQAVDQMEKDAAAEEQKKSKDSFGKKLMKLSMVVAGIAAAFFGLSYALKNFGQWLIRSNDHLKDYNFEIANSMAKYKLHQRSLDVQKAQNMAGNITNFTESQMRFEKAFQPFEEMIESAVMNSAAFIMDGFSWLLEAWAETPVIGALHDWLVGEKKKPEGLTRFQSKLRQIQMNDMNNRWIDDPNPHLGP